MNEIGRGAGWENDVKMIVIEVLNGGSKCMRGQSNANRIDSIQSELTEEKEERKDMGKEIKEKLEEINRTVIIGCIMIILGVVITKLF